ncbi:MAG TPA: tRNA (adenosine(37)-N6)-threonylcarbamoyltransferase complex transferase subunit TsaD [Desulfonatronum sp.]|nr:tRNA (adenosine(37)-N6)-threonylcarbamoyltransferase complex transferase subunit TsaD [Desulfonatronum sp.]
MRCLGIETSCDETSFALVQDGRLLAQVLHSQENLHALFGGVVPELASRRHLQTMPGLLRGLFQKTGLTPNDIHIIAVARGPGLLGALLVGLGLAKGLAMSLHVPLVGVNHLHAHLLAPGLEQQLLFPALGLLVSGGHTHLYRIEAADQFHILGRCLDDAAGEALDKSASLLNMPYPGGRHVDQVAAMAEPDRTLLPKPYLDNQNLDFSFSGLKTAVAHHVADHAHLRLPKLANTSEILEWARTSPDFRIFCASLNWTITETLRIKVERALRQAGPVSSLIVAGGVAANTMLRQTLARTAQQWRIPLILPNPSLCTDNAAMIAYAGLLLFEKGWMHGLDLEAFPRGKPIPWDYSFRENVPINA